VYNGDQLHLGENVLQIYPNTSNKSEIQQHSQETELRLRFAHVPGAFFKTDNLFFDVTLNIIGRPAVHSHTIITL